MLSGDAEGGIEDMGVIERFKGLHKLVTDLTADLNEWTRRAPEIRATAIQATLYRQALEEIAGHSVVRPDGPAGRLVKIAAKALAE